DGQLRLEYGARDGLFVEGPEIFDGTAATGEDENVDEFLLIEKFERTNDFARRFFALHADGIEGEMDVVKTAPQDANYVPDCGAFGRSDQADAAGKKRQRFFARGIEEAFRFETLLELLESELERAAPLRLHGLDVNLIFAALLVDADASAHGDL